MTTSKTKIGELEEMKKIVQCTLDFYNTTFRSVGFDFGGKLEVNNMSIELKYYSATPFCIQMAEFHIKDKKDMQYFLNHITNQWNKWKK